jgi:hypothetical protein
MKDKLELRLYFFTIYQLMGIQKGIQSGHAALRFVLKYARYDPNHIIWDFIENHETWIVLNGGTTNDEEDIDGMSLGSINQLGESLYGNNIEFSVFREPDLNNAITALCFICDERVFNKKDYPDFIYWLLNVKMYAEAGEVMPMENRIKLKLMTDNELQNAFPEYYKEWVRLIGGLKNEFLRELTRDKKLA